MPPVRDTTNGIRYVMRREIRHSRAHLHIIYAGRAASIALDDQSVLAGSLPSKQLAEACDWMRLHNAELLAMWPHRMESGGIYKITG